MHGKNGLEATADVEVDAVSADTVDVVVVPGGWAADKQRHGTERPVGTDPQLIGTVWASAPHAQRSRYKLSSCGYPATGSETEPQDEDERN